MRWAVVVGLTGALAVAPRTVAAQGTDGVGVCNECQACFNEECGQSWYIGHSFLLGGDPDYWFIGEHSNCACGNCHGYHIPCEPDPEETDALILAFQEAIFGDGNPALAAASHAEHVVLTADGRRLDIVQCGRRLASYLLTTRQAEDVAWLLRVLLPA